ncbi:UNVERIFIED_CONTAM: hypothetical protein NCL1_44258 [Trichonephila clavipes]
MIEYWVANIESLRKIFPKRNMSNSTRQEFHKAMYDIQLTHNVSQNESNTWSWSVFTKSKMQTTLAMDPALGIHILCYSSNIHFENDSEEPETFGKYCIV